MGDANPSETPLPIPELMELFGVTDRTVRRWKDEAPGCFVPRTSNRQKILGYPSRLEAWNEAEKNRTQERRREAHERNTATPEPEGEDSALSEEATARYLNATSAKAILKELDHEPGPPQRQGWNARPPKPTQARRRPSRRSQEPQRTRSHVKRRRSARPAKKPDMARKNLELARLLEQCHSFCLERIPQDHGDVIFFSENKLPCRIPLSSEILDELRTAGGLEDWARDRYGIGSYRLQGYVLGLPVASLDVQVKGFAARLVEARSREHESEQAAKRRRASKKAAARQERVLRERSQDAARAEAAFRSWRHQAVQRLEATLRSSVEAVASYRSTLATLHADWQIKATTRQLRALERLGRDPQPSQQSETDSPFAITSSPYDALLKIAEEYVALDLAAIHSRLDRALLDRGFELWAQGCPPWHHHVYLLVRDVLPPPPVLPSHLPTVA
jgi:hypothetical protein